MDTLRLCPHCRFLRPQMVALHCCGVQVCLECLHSAQRCPQCSTALLQRHHSTEGENPLAVRVPTLRCPHLGCAYETVDLLMPKHVLECEHRPASSSDASSEMPVLAQALPGNAGEAARRDALVQRANVFKHFVGFDNVTRALKAGGHAPPQPDGAQAAGGAATQRSVLGADGRLVAAAAAADQRGEAARFEVKHMVMPTDTLEGLALAYGCDVGDIRKRNKLFGSLIGRLFVMIPAAKMPRSQTIEELEEVLRKKLVGKFKQMCKGCTHEEAEYYLENALYELATAVHEFESDAKWEQANAPACPQEQPATPPEHSQVMVQVLELLGCA